MNLRNPDGPVNLVLRPRRVAMIRLSCTRQPDGGNPLPPPVTLMPPEVCRGIAFAGLVARNGILFDGQIASARIVGKPETGSIPQL